MNFFENINHTVCLFLVTFIPEQPNRLSFGTQYFDNGWILTEITWQLPSRTETSAQSINSFSANRDPNNNLASWGNDAVYVMFVERRSCDSYQLGKSEMVPGLSGVKMKSNKFLLKLEAPAKRGCFEYTVKVNYIYFFSDIFFCFFLCFYCYFLMIFKHCSQLHGIVGDFQIVLMTTLSIKMSE